MFAKMRDRNVRKFFLKWNPPWGEVVWSGWKMLTPIPFQLPAMLSHLSLRVRSLFTLCLVYGFGEICTKDADCDATSRLRCASGHCACPNQTETYYDHTTSLCRLRIGSVCQTKNDSLRCPSDANCVQIPNPELQNFTWCQCNETYPTPADSLVGSGSTRGNYPTCLKGKWPFYFELMTLDICGDYSLWTVLTHNATCHSFLSHNRTRNVCNSTSLLTCAKGRCSCDVDRDQKWDSVNERCAVGKGKTCRISRNNLVPDSIYLNAVESPYNQVPCMAGLKCVILTSTEYLRKGICADKQVPQWRFE